MNHRRLQGFTLVELAIVLTAIALLIAGIVVGKSLIKIATIHATIRQMQEFNSAVNTFAGKYNCLPGDCKKASNYGFASTSNGNGDGIIGECYASPTCRSASFDNEYVNFWYHLSAAQLIGGNYPAWSGVVNTSAGTASPQIKLTAVYNGGLSSYGWVVTADIYYSMETGMQVPKHNFMFGTDVVAIGSSAPGYPPADIAMIDQKIDDGLPTRGNVLAWNYSLTNVLTRQTVYGTFATMDGLNDDVCIKLNVTPPLYDIAYTSTVQNGLCSVMIKAAF